MNLVYPSAMACLRPVLLLLLALTLLPSCDLSTDREEDQQVEVAMEAITDEVKEKERDDIINEEMKELDDIAAAEYVQQVETLRKEKERLVATSPILRFAEDRQGLITHLEEKVDAARPECKVDELFDYLEKLSDDPIFKAVKKDPDHAPALKAVYKEARELKDSCKGR